MDVKTAAAFSSSCSQSRAEMERAEATFFRFTVVRDPFERLYSCYRDKMVDNPHWSLANFRKAVKDRWGRRRSRTSEGHSAEFDENIAYSKIIEKT